MDPFVVFICGVIALSIVSAIFILLMWNVYCFMYIKLIVKPTLVLFCDPNDPILITSKGRFYNRKYVIDLNLPNGQDSIFELSRGAFVEWHEDMRKRGWKPV